MSTVVIFFQYPPPGLSYNIKRISDVDIVEQSKGILKIQYKVGGIDYYHSFDLYTIAHYQVVPK